ncbi:MAG: prolipoprotein diacylglyceryl transferase [Alphaproteobacteria bacterium]
MALPFPSIDPVAFHIGPVAVRWYALAYLGAFLFGWRYCMSLVRNRLTVPLPKNYDDYVTWSVAGVVLGGRLGYVLVYNLDHYIKDPMDILATWHGGMSFHGGLAGVLLSAWLYARKHKIGFWRFMDPLAAATPIGLFLGRLANFVNGELFGRATDIPWGMVFPHGGDQPRHPSQLYQAGMEGLLLFLVLFIITKKTRWQEHPGLLSGVFLIGYGIARIVGEFFRQPDAQIGFLWGGITMGQLLSLPMVAFGLWLIRRAMRPTAQ